MINYQIKLKAGEPEDALKTAVERAVKTDPGKYSWHIEKRSVDARDKENILLVYTIAVEFNDTAVEKKLIDRSHGTLRHEEPVRYSFSPEGAQEMSHRPVVVGAGPAGMFAAFMLSSFGYAPLVIERGSDVDSRTVKVSRFWETGVLDEECNVQFGEGGAGTFSDGKLNTGVKDKSGRIRHVLETFVRFGAPEEILFSAKPHIGTDILKNIMKQMRLYSIKNGAEFKFDTKVTDLLTDDGNNLKAVRLSNGDEIPCEACILAVGHSARDTFRMLSGKNLILEQKAFAIGLRIEHLQETIGLGQYGENYRLLPPADYKMTHTAVSGRGVYSFCMCPGGHVVNASSVKGMTCVNGMSYSGRNGKNANSAIVVQVTPEDFKNEGFDDVLSGMRFQEKWEKAAYGLCGGLVPIQRFQDFKDKKTTVSFGNVLPETKGKWGMADLNPALPSYVARDIIEGVEAYGRKLKGFSDGDALLSGVETRTSSPLRIVRDEELQSAIRGLYPCGEGAGYAGGIMSAAVDGIKVFEKIAGKYKGKCL